ncbi:MAG: hypothetical protein CVV03_08170 [Firmicutes bacterium HGW-Firmicutes-8]|nr:MAG: hypothetical protein CVV03_08170 [Firmicutes bacterium HGW-Firmicutes-8]
MDVGRQKSEVGQSLYFLFSPKAAVLKRRPRLGVAKILGRGRCVPEGQGFPHFVGTAGAIIAWYQSEPGVPVIKWGFLRWQKGLGILTGFPCAAVVSNLAVTCRSQGKGSQHV